MASNSVRVFMFLWRDIPYFDTVFNLISPMKFSTNSELPLFLNDHKCRLIIVLGGYLRSLQFSVGCCLPQNLSMRLLKKLISKN